VKQKDAKLLKKFAQNLKKLREAEGISQRELSSRCDVDYAKISKIEGLKANLYITTLFELAEGLGIHPRELLDFEID
jgi:transcriptional regulator with XRE-family HTH domain